MTKPALLAARLAAVLRDAGVGEGEHLTEEWVAGRLGVSRTPARRAMALGSPRDPRPLHAGGPADVRCGARPCGRGAARQRG